MKWHNEQWRKLYTKITGEWLQLSVLARGIAAELLRYAKDGGGLCRASPETAAAEVAHLLSAKPREIRSVREAVDELIGDRYLEVVDGYVFIRNFVDAQERLSPAARRQQRYRDNHQGDREKPDGDGDEHNDDANVSHNALPSSSHNALCDKNVETKRNETKRNETKRDHDFDLVWAEYPRKVDKAHARKTFAKRIKTDSDLLKVAAAVRSYAQECRGKQPDFILHFASFLNRDKWLDDSSAASGISAAAGVNAVAPHVARMIAEAEQGDNPLDDLFAPKDPE